MYWTTLCFSFDGRNGAPIKKEITSQSDIFTETLCWQMAKSEKKGVEGSFGKKKQLNNKKKQFIHEEKNLTIGQKVSHG